jgi:hypothetical protein
MKVCEYVRRGRVVVRWIPTDQNWADIFTKPLAAEKFYQFWKQMCGYEPWQVPNGTTAAAGAIQFEFIPIDFTHWEIDETQVDEMDMAKIAARFTDHQAVDDVSASVLWIPHPSPHRWAISETEVQAPTTSTNSNAIRNTVPLALQGVE